MYQAFFGLREKPFNLTPDPKFLYLNSSYREALASLHYAIAERKGFATLVGEAGTGKTTLLRRLLSELPRDTRSVLVINPAVSFEELLRFILTDLGRPPTPGTTKLQMTEALNAELLDTLARGGNVVVLIDEAQDLTIPVLEELRLLSNLETAKEKILQFVLAGQPEFESMLSRPEIRQLRQRIAVNARLRPLGRREVKSYVAARIAAAGGDERGLFRPPALYRLWRFSGGVPRLVNVACDNALVTAYAAGKRTVSWKGMGEAVRDLSSGRRGSGRGFGVPAVRFGTIAAAAMLGAGGAYALSHLAADSETQPLRVVAAPVEVPAAAPVAHPASARQPGAFGERPTSTDARFGDGSPAAAGTARRNVRDDDGGQRQYARGGQEWQQRAAAAPETQPQYGRAEQDQARAEQDQARAEQDQARAEQDRRRAPERDRRRAVVPAEDVPRRDPASGVVPDGRYTADDARRVAPEMRASGTAGGEGDQYSPRGAGADADGLAADRATPPPGERGRPDVAIEPARRVDTRVPERATSDPREAERLARADAPVGASASYVRVERGDTITAIVQRHYGYVTPELLDAVQRANPELRNIDVIMVGGTLVLPPTSG